MTEQLNEPHVAAFLHSGDGYMHEQWVDLRRDNACNPRALILQDHHQSIVARLKAENSALQQRLNEADQRVDEAEQLLRDLVTWSRATDGDLVALVNVVSRADAICQLTKDSPEVGS